MQTTLLFQLESNPRSDLSRLSGLLTAAGLPLRRVVSLPADRCPLEAALRRASAEAGVALVLTLGAAGPGPRDIAPDALSAVLTQPLPGMAAALRAALPEPESQLFRGQAGLRGTVLLANLPPSPEGALRAILPAVQAYLHR